MSKWIVVGKFIVCVGGFLLVWLFRGLSMKCGGSERGIEYWGMGVVGFER